MAIPEATAARRLRHWKVLFSVFMQDGLAYRPQGLIWTLTDVTLAVTMPLVWISAAKGGTIHGFAAEDFVLYIPADALPQRPALPDRHVPVVGADAR